MTASPKPFKRTISADPADYGSKIRVHYKPDGFWTGEAIIVNIDFTPVGMRTFKKGQLVIGGMDINYDIRHGGGGQNDDVDPLVAAESFTQAYKDAIKFTQDVLALAKEDGAEFKEICRYVLALDMKPDTFGIQFPGPEEISITLVDIGDGVIASYNKLWADVETAKAELSKGRNVVQFVEREADLVEKTYWWTMHHKYGTPIVA